MGWKIEGTLSPDIKKCILLESLWILLIISQSSDEVFFDIFIENGG